MTDFVTFSRLHLLLSKAFETFSGKQRAAGLQTVLALTALKYLNDSGGNIPQIRSDLNITIPAAARWSALRKMKIRAGVGLNAAFSAMETANPHLFSGVFNGMDLSQEIPDCRTDDKTLLRMIHLFDQIGLSHDHLAYPELPGKVSRALVAALRFTPKTDPGAFTTPQAVAQLLVSAADPRPGERIYDPAAGAGETLIRAAEHVAAAGGRLKNILLCGQEIDPAAWAVSRMNLLFYGVHGAEVLNGDTLVSPAHIDTDGRLDQFACIVSHLPFHIRRPRGETAYPDRFFAVTPQPGAKAAVMFMQHIVSTLRPDGRAAVIAPGETLFQIKYMQKLRKQIIADRRLDAVVGLPPNLFPDASAPACMLLLRRSDAKDPEHVFFVNAERRCRKERPLNVLAAEDVEAIVHALRYRAAEEGFCRRVAVGEIERNGYDLTVSRYVSADPSPARHDVRAHLNGGVPLHELQAFDRWFAHYKGTYKLLFKERNPFYADFSDTAHEKRDIGFLIRAAPGVIRKRIEFRRALDEWWAPHADALKELPETKAPHQFRGRVMEALAQGRDGAFDLLPVPTLRAACAEFLDDADCRLRTIAARGWRTRMIPDEEILRQRFPDVMAQIDADARRLEDIERSVHGADNAAVPSAAEVPLLQAKDVKILAQRKKELDDEIRRLRRNLSNLRQNGAAAGADASSAEETAHVSSLVEKVEKEIAALSRLSETIAARLNRHRALEAEMNTLKTGLKSALGRKKSLADEARGNLSADEERRLILDGLRRMLLSRFDDYLERDLAQFIAAMEALWDKYAFSVQDILAERRLVASVMDRFFEEMGYVTPEPGTGT